jgi:hypothetical protein
MNIKEFTEQLSKLDKIEFEGVPDHFHITEVGITTKDFIDCGGTVRREQTASFQLWVADDVDHRLKPEKLVEIIAKAQNELLVKFVRDDSFAHLVNLEIEIEYQTDTIGKYGLEFDGKFKLIPKQTDCLAKDKCGVEPKTSCCPGSKCC